MCVYAAIGVLSPTALIHLLDSEVGVPNVSPPVVADRAVWFVVTHGKGVGLSCAARVSVQSCTSLRQREFRAHVGLAVIRSAYGRRPPPGAR